MASSHSTLSSTPDGAEPATPDSDQARLSPLLAEFPTVPTKVSNAQPPLLRESVAFTDPFRPRNTSPHSQEYRRLDLCNDSGHHRRHNAEPNAAAQRHTAAEPTETRPSYNQRRPRASSKPQLSSGRDLLIETELLARD